MNKGDLIELVCADAGVSRVQAAKAIQSIIRSISAALKRGDHVTINRFGRFYTRKHRASKRRNPQTGALMVIGPKVVAKFAAGNGLSRGLNKE